MIGAIAGDIIGSIYEWDNIKTKDFPLFPNGVFITDDTVLTVATADAMLNNKDYGDTYCKYMVKYPGKTYGPRFLGWCAKKYILFGLIKKKNNSFGNGSAMRVSPIGYISNNIDEVLKEAKNTANNSHSHPEGIKGAQCIAGVVFLARKGKGKEEIKKYVEEKFGYDLNRKLDNIRPIYTFNETCQGTVPEAIISFLESNDFEDAIRNAISIGGDSDTLACITGGIAEAYYGVPKDIKEKVLEYLPEEFNVIINDFYKNLKKLNK